MAVVGVLGLLVTSGLVGCGRGDGATAEPLEPLYSVSQAEISHESTQAISVYWPDAEGSWPVVHLFPGRSGWRSLPAMLAQTLASQGLVVFVPGYRSSIWGGPRLPEAQSDLVCAWRYGNSVAGEYGGDLDQPVTLAGWDSGGDLALEYGLRGGGADVGCLTAAPDPEVVVGVATCRNATSGFDPSGWTNRDANVVLVSGSIDRYCASAGAEWTNDQLQKAGFDSTYVEIGGGTHWNVAFLKGEVEGAYDVVDPRAYVPSSPAGVAVVRTILDAIDAAR